MLEHQKTVLRGVSHDKHLFRKELVKSIAWLNAQEQTELRKWVNEQYYTQHKDIIKELLYPRYDFA